MLPMIPNVSRSFHHGVLRLRARLRPVTSLRMTARWCASILFFQAFFSGVAAISAETTALTFERDVRPILKSHCFHCHGEGEKLSGGVDLRLRRLMLHPATDGAQVIVPGKPEESEMVKLVREGEMPKKGRKLTAGEMAVL